MKSDSARQFCLWLRRIPVDEIGDRIDSSHSRCKRVARWLMAASLVLLLGYGQTLASQTTASKAKDDTADDDFYSPYAVAVDGSGNVYIDDSYNNRVLKETPSGDSYKQSIVVCCDLSNSSGVAVDGSGNVYVADSGNNHVLKESPSGSSYIQSMIGSDLEYPYGVAVDGSGNVYIADTGKSRVLRRR